MPDGPGISPENITPLQFPEAAKPSVEIAGQVIDSVRVAIPALEHPRAELAQPEAAKPPLVSVTSRRRMREPA